ncbi:MAG: hypothetical protein ACI364_02405 [Coriobacteriales bacterium]
MLARACGVLAFAYQVFLVIMQYRQSGWKWLATMPVLRIIAFFCPTILGILLFYIGYRQSKGR